MPTDHNSRNRPRRQAAKMTDTPLLQLWSAALLWPAMAAQGMSELASAAAHELSGFANDLSAAPRSEPAWTTVNEIALELESVRLRRFESRSGRPPTIICAPFALHSATVADFAPEHSLVETLTTSGLEQAFVTDWRSASPAMRFRSIDSYLADVNVLVDSVGGHANLVGLCQGGWLALIFAARFPGKVGKLVIAGAPINTDAGDSEITRLVRATPMAVYEHLVALGEGRVSGRRLLQFWNAASPDASTISRSLQLEDNRCSSDFEDRFRLWYNWTYDLPGTYYLEVIRRLYMDNQLATGRLVALGRQVDLSSVTAPVLLIAASEDEFVAPAQVFEAERLIGPSAASVDKMLVPSSHLALFMGRRSLSDYWTKVARWLA